MSHLTPNEIARLSAGKCEPTEAKSLAAHLRECEACREDYEFTVRTHAKWETDPGAFPAGVAPDVEVTGDAGQARLRPGRRRPWLPAVAVALALSAVVIAVYFATTQSPASVDPALAATIQGAMQTMSNRGLTVLPRTVERLETAGDTYRSGAVVDDPGVFEALRELAAQSGEPSRERAVLLAGGFLATGEFESARDVALTGLSNYPDDDDLSILLALAQYELGDTNEALVLLNEITQRRPGSALALINLAVVEFAAGRTDEGLVHANQAANLSLPLADRVALIERLFE